MMIMAMQGMSMEVVQDMEIPRGILSTLISIIGDLIIHGFEWGSPSHNIHTNNYIHTVTTEIGVFPLHSMMRNCRVRGHYTPIRRIVILTFRKTQ
jgi:hypothetical protein